MRNVKVEDVWCECGRIEIGINIRKRKLKNNGRSLKTGNTKVVFGRVKTGIRYETVEKQE